MTKFATLFCDLWLNNAKNNRRTIFLNSKSKKQIGNIENQFSTTKPLIPNDMDTFDEQPRNSKEYERLNCSQRG